MACLSETQGMGLYIHIPFCASKCGYCDFASWVGRENLMHRYVNALCRELAQCAARDADGKHFRTLYIGGGTPTMLPVEEIERILEHVHACFSPAEGAECTIEANPGTVTAASLDRLRRLGMNRISFGVQSFSDAILKTLGRIHTAKEAREAIELAAACGFSNVNLDLMYGLPTQTFGDLKRSVAEACTLPITHISVYGLQIEAGTPLYTAWENGALALPDDGLTDAMYDFLAEELPAAGFFRYEISNYAKSGCESRHNLSYWRDVPYLGIGASAHSYLNGVRYANLFDVQAYIDCIESGGSPRHMEREAERTAHMEEVAFLSLRMREGISKARFQETFHASLDAVYGAVIRRCVERGLLAETATHIHLTPSGMKYGNQVFSAFLLE